MLRIFEAEGAEDIATARRLFREYAESLGFSLCFQGFERELATMPGEYAPPAGCLYLAEWLHEPAGCIALRPLSDSICEMKRLYVRPQFRAKGIGHMLVDIVLASARQIGYKAIRLDTVPGSMDSAIALYRRYGFQEIKPYTEHPTPGSICMELELRSQAATKVGS